MTVRARLIFFSNYFVFSKMQLLSALLSGFGIAFALAVFFT